MIIGYVGCYINDKENHEFNSFASHLNLSDLKPQTCIAACSAVGYVLSAIEDGNLCFCKSSITVYSIRDNDTSCQSLSCPGDPTLDCGSINNIMVYEAGSSTKINSVTFLDNSPSVALFSPISFQVDFLGSPENLFVNEDLNMVGNYDMLNTISNQINYTYYVTKTQADFIEIAISPFGQNSDKVNIWKNIISYF